jgi:8-oxo-dGTP diphosphatase
MTSVGIRAVAILIKDNEVLLIHRTRNGKEFWAFPGGGKEEDESIEEAVVREVEEEASIKCKIVKLLYTHIYSDLEHKQFYYLCDYISGNPKLGNYNEAETMKKENQTYEPVWIKVESLSKKLVYPLEIREWLIEDYRTGFKNVPRSVTLKSTELRQEM